ncbi:MAG: DUF305 domain-containing protein [Clostridiales bacterium]|nr:DUF305 domain-containing protein [Clostridiales bacterium]
MKHKHPNYRTVIIALIILILILFFLFLMLSAGNAEETPPLAQEDRTETTDPQMSNHDTVPSPDSSAGESVSDTTDTADTDRDLQQYLKEQGTIMTQMMEDMDLEASGNASVDFLKGMIPHHKSAIDMANSYLAYGGEHPKFRQLAKDIVAAQTQEIEEMERLIEEIEASGETDEEQEQAYLNTYRQMMEGHTLMDHGTTDAQDVETAFAEGMILHHQMAVDMSKAILEYTDHEEVRTLANTIIEAQEKEIREMQEIQ